MTPKHLLLLLALLFVGALLCVDARLHEQNHLKRHLLIEREEAEYEKKPFLEKKPPHLEKPAPPGFGHGHGSSDKKPFLEKKPPIALKPVPPGFGHGHGSSDGKPLLEKKPPIALKPAPWLGKGKGRRGPPGP